MYTKICDFPIFGYMYNFCKTVFCFKIKKSNAKMCVCILRNALKVYQIKNLKVHSEITDFKRKKEIECFELLTAFHNLVSTLQRKDGNTYFPRTDFALSSIYLIYISSN